MLHAMNYLEALWYFALFIDLDLLGFLILSCFKPIEFLHGHQMEFLGNQVLAVVIAYWGIAWESIVPTLGELFN